VFTYTVLQANVARVLPVSGILNLVCVCHLGSFDERSAYFRFISTEDNTNTNTHKTNIRVSRVIRSHSLAVRTVEDTTRIRQRYVQLVAAAGFCPQEAS